MLGQGDPTREETDLDVKEAVEAACESMTCGASTASSSGPITGSPSEARRWQDRGWWRLRPPPRPVEAYVIRSDEVYWESALDLNRVILGRQIVALLALLVLRSIRRARP